MDGRSTGLEEFYDLQYNPVYYSILRRTWYSTCATNAALRPQGSLAKNYFWQEQNGQSAVNTQHINLQMLQLFRGSHKGHHLLFATYLSSPLF